MELSFDTDQGRTMARKMLSAHDQLSQTIATTQRLSDALTASSWQAPAATQFNIAVKGWTGAMKPTLTQLAEARRRLELEIKEWEQTAQDFEGDSAGASGLTFGPTSTTTPTAESSEAEDDKGVKGKVEWKFGGDEADKHKGNKKSGPEFGIEKDLVDGSVFTQHAGPVEFNELGGKAGVKAGYGPDGLNAGLTAEAYAAKVKAEGTLLGDKDLGWKASGEAKFGSAEGKVGIIDSSLDANIEASIASAEGGTGVQTTYGDVGVHGGIRAGLKFGGKLGKHTEVSLGPVTLGVDVDPHFGEIGSGIKDGWNWLTD